MSQVLIAGKAERGLSGEISPPGDKSISHRSIMLGSLADGETVIEGFLPGGDNLCTASMFEAMGVRIDWLSEDKSRLRVHGVGMAGLREPEDVLDAGNSGTTARLMTGILAGQPFLSVMSGDASLRKRPMARVFDPVQQMGAGIYARAGNAKLPVAIQGGGLQGIHYQSSVSSAQVKSCVILAALYAKGDTVFEEPGASRDHTERMLEVFGHPIEKHGNVMTVQPCEKLIAPAQTFFIPSDPSSATFFAVAASLIDGSEIDLVRVGINPRRDGWRKILTAMQASIQTKKDAADLPEPVANLRVSQSALRGVSVDPADITDAIDEFPALFVAAALADGTFSLRGAEELRAKESDRIRVMAEALNQCGARVSELDDGVEIEGVASLQGGVSIDANHDHRIAMSMVVAAQCSERPIRITGADSIQTSFPDFVPMAQKLGMNVRWEM